jgi:DNA-binding transcriptional ArsR family regulator
MSGVSTSFASRQRIPHPGKESLELATILRVVGDPLRLDIVRLLSDGAERNCAEMTAALGIPASTGSYHLKLLREAGVTRTRADGTLRLISLRTEDLDERFPGLVALLAQQ